jgi:hypothetical protein
VFGPDDRVFFWYGSQGLLRVRYHLVGNATDATGNIVGRIVSDSDQSLTDLHLVRPGVGPAAGDEQE